MKNIIENLILTMPEVDLIPSESEPKILDIEKAEFFIKVYVDKLFEQNFYEINYENGSKLNIKEINDLKELLTNAYLVNWLNKHFDTDLDPTICHLIVKGTKFHN